MASRVNLALTAGLAVTIAAVSFFLFEPATALVSCLLGWTMLAIAAIDAREFIVPDILSLPAIPAGLIVAWLWADGAPFVLMVHLAAALLAAVTFYAIRQLYYRWRGREGLGLGDVKLAAAAGAWTGLPGLGYVLLLASLFAIGAVLAMHLNNPRAIRGSTAVAYGVFLAPAIWFVWCANQLDPDFAGMLALP